MPIDIQFIGWDKLKGTAQFIRAERERFKAGLKEESERFKTRWIQTVKDKYLQGPRPEKLDRKTGLLINSITGITVEEGDTMEVFVGTPVKYARIHEFGGTVTRKGKKKTSTWTMRKRPFLRPGLEDALPGFERAVEKRIREIRLAE